MPQHRFKKGDKKPATSGRKPGVLNHRTVFIKGMLEEAVVRMGGLEGFLKWANKNDENRTIFWSQLMPRLMPIQVQGTGKDGALVLQVTHEELASKLIERGLPPVIFDVEVPRLEDHGVINGNGNGEITNGNGETGE